MSQRRIFIGDVHGHYDGLMLLLEAIAPGKEDQVYFLGDLIDRGPKSAQVVDFVRHSPYQCLLGNHELILLYFFPDAQITPEGLADWVRIVDRGTFPSYKKIGISKLIEHVQWFQTLPTHLDLGDIWIAHAGVDPNLPLEQQTAKQFCWIRDPFHKMTQPYFPDKLIVTGHTITCTFNGVEPGKLVQGQGWIDIDTGAYLRMSGWLTGLDIANRLVYQVNVFENIVRTLPLEEAVTHISPHQRLRSFVAGSKLLVVEENEEIRKVFKQMLSQAKFEILEAKNAEEAINTIKDESPQQILLDWISHKQSGLKVFQFLQSDRKLQQIPLVVMASRKEDVAEKVSEPFESFIFLEKPFEKKQLIAAISSALLQATRRTAKQISLRHSSHSGKSDARKSQST